MARRPRRSRESRAFNWDEVDSSPRFVPKGTYLVEVSELSREQGKADDYYKWVFKVIEGKHEGAKLYHNTSLAPQALFSLKRLLEALDVELPETEDDIDPKDYMGLEVNAVVVEDDSYDGTPRPKINDFFPANDSKSRTERRRGEKDETEDDDRPRRGRSSRDEDKEDNSRSSRRDRTNKKREEPDPVSAEEVEEMKQRELEDLVEKLELDVELKGTLTKMRSAVIDALEAAELLAE